MFRKASTWPLKPSASPGERLYVIGDIHGRLDLLDAMLDLIDDDLAARSRMRSRLVFLGDYVDRGPNTAQVIHRLIEVAECYDAILLKGNHEEILTEFLDKPQVIDQWRDIGGLTTLLSYGIATSLRPSEAEAEWMSDALRAAMPSAHLDFLQRLRPIHISGDYAFVHAGLRPGIPCERQHEQDLLWIRQEFITSEIRHDKFIVHGHTPVRVPDVRHNRINIDTGAYASGRLSCLVLEERERRFFNT